MDIAFNPADYPTYNIGDKVTIRQWDDMASEFGLDEYPRVRICYRLPLRDRRRLLQTEHLHTNSIRHKKICHEPKTTILCDTQFRPTSHP